MLWRKASGAGGVGGGGGGGYPEYVATAEFSTAVSTTTYSIPVPSGTTDGDLLIIFITHTSARTTSTPSGFTLQYSAGPASTTSGNVRGYCFSRIISGTPPASYTFTATSTVSVNARALTYRPASGQTIGYVSDVYSTTTQSGTSLIAPSLTLAEDGLLLCGWHVDNASTLTYPAGMDTFSVVADGSDNLIGVATEEALAGSTGTRTATVASSLNWNAGALAIYYT